MYNIVQHNIAFQDNMFRNGSFRTRFIIDSKADYLLSTKGNQKELKDDIEKYVQDETIRSQMDSCTKTQKAHGRLETRSAYTSDAVGSQPVAGRWPELRCIGAIHTRFETNNGITEQWHYYISSRALGAEQLLHHARGQWSVESMHWLLDVHFTRIGAGFRVRPYNRISIWCINLLLI